MSVMWSMGKFSQCEIIMRGAIYVENSKNSKLMGSKPVDSTYSSILHTCPDTCELKDAGCYAQMSYVGMVNYRNERRARGADPLSVARAEAQAIDAAYNGKQVPEGRMMRIHVAGDSRTVKGTRVINLAVKRWKARGGAKDGVWSYTHAWKHVPRKEWSNVSVLASVDNVEEVAQARKMGYSPAIVVSKHTSDKAYQLAGCDTVFIPCPNQTRDVGCSDCKLCCKADWLFKENKGIAFAAHGARKNAIKKRHLPVIA